MVKVKLFGVIRLQAGVSGFETEARSIDEVRSEIPGVTKREAKDLVVMVNGKSVSRWYRLKDGDEVVFLSPAGGG